MTQTFDEPATGGGDRLNPRDILGHLMIVHPLEYLTGIKTQFSRTIDGSDAIKVDVVTLDMFNENGTNIWRNVLWFQSQLILGLRPKIGGILLGRMTRGAGKPGQQQPYVFESASQDTVAVGRAQAWLTQHPEFVQPQNTQSSPLPPNALQQPYQPNATQQPTQPDALGQQSVLDRLRQQSQQPFPTSGQSFSGNPPF